MNKALRIARMEFKMTAANKAFIIITILGPLVIVGMAFLPSLLMQSASAIEEGTTIAIAGGDGKLFDAVTTAAVDSPIRFVRGTDVDELARRVAEREIDGYVVVPEDYLRTDTLEYYSRTGTDFVIAETIQGYFGNVIVSLRMRAAGLDPQRIAYLSARPEVLLRSATGEPGSAGGDVASTIFTAIAFTLLLYLTILLYGQATARSVLKEKTSKTVEIMLSSVRPIDMLFGKLLGQVFAALLQYAIWVGAGYLIVSLVGPRLGVELPATISTGTFGFLVLFFLLAFFLYSAAYAAIGSGAEDETHVGQLGWPLIIFLVLPMMLVSAIVMRPDAPLVIALSYVPFTAPIIMFIRTMIDMPAAWEIVLVVAIMIVSIVGMTAVSAKIFRVGLLMSGKRFSIADIARWVRY